MISMCSHTNVVNQNDFIGNLSVERTSSSTKATLTVYLWMFPLFCPHLRKLVASCKLDHEMALSSIHKVVPLSKGTTRYHPLEQGCGYLSCSNGVQGAIPPKRDASLFVNNLETFFECGWYIYDAPNCSDFELGD